MTRPWEISTRDYIWTDIVKTRIVGGDPLLDYDGEVDWTSVFRQYKRARKLAQSALKVLDAAVRADVEVQPAPLVLEAWTPNGFSISGPRGAMQRLASPGAVYRAAAKERGGAALRFRRKHGFDPDDAHDRPAVDWHLADERGPKWPNSSPPEVNVAPGESLLLDGPMAEAEYLRAARVVRDDHRLTGRGVRVTMCDTGILNRVREHLAVDRQSQTVTTELPITAVLRVVANGVDLTEETDWEVARDISNRTIKLLGENLPASVVASYSALHPYHLSKMTGAGSITSVRVGPGDPFSDAIGHGTMTSAEVITIAPEIDLVMICDGGLTAFRKALCQYVESQRSRLRKGRAAQPHVISCSWGLKYTDPAQKRRRVRLGDEVAHARKLGTTVLFSVGNEFRSRLEPPALVARTDNTTERVSVSADDAIMVGGALPLPHDPTRGYDFSASSYASSYGFLEYLYRRAPDVCGIAGTSHQGMLTKLPTQPSGRYDRLRARDHTYPGLPRYESDGTSPSDGWVLASGTSTATAQVAGVVALMHEAQLRRRDTPWLQPRAIRNILEETAQPVKNGRSANRRDGRATNTGRNKPTGWGVVDATAAVGWLRPGCCVAVGRPGGRADGQSDLIVAESAPRWEELRRNEAGYDVRRMVGIDAKHKAPSQLREAVAANRIFEVRVRVMNQGSMNCSGFLTLNLRRVSDGSYLPPQRERYWGDERLNAGDYDVVIFRTAVRLPGMYDVSVTIDCEDCPCDTDCEGASGREWAIRTSVLAAAVDN